MNTPISGPTQPPATRVVLCANCDTPLPIYPSWLARGQVKRWCNSECRRQSLFKTLTCPVCHNGFTVPASDTSRKYCSRACSRARPRKAIPHGTRTGYNRGCHCEECRAAHAASMRTTRRAATGKGDHLPHGTAHRYFYYGCRCVPCRDAHAAVCKRYRTKRRERRVAVTDYTRPTGEQE